MAIARFSVSVGLKNNGTKTSAVAHASYAMGLGKYAKKSDEIVYTKSHLPQWADNDPLRFWELAEQNERANANLYKEHIISLPRELTLEQNIALIDDWIAKELKGQHYYNYAIHNPKAKDGLEQPHCHLMFCERINDGIERTAEQYFKRYNSKNPEKGGAKKANTGLTQAQLKQNLIEQRKRYGEVLQHHLNLANVDYVVDMRNWKERGLDEPPKNKSFAEIQAEKRINKGLDKNPIYQEIQNEYYSNLPTFREIAEQGIVNDIMLNSPKQDIEYLDDDIMLQFEKNLDETKDEIILNSLKFSSNLPKSSSLGRFYSGFGLTNNLNKGDKDRVIRYLNRKEKPLDEFIVDVAQKSFDSIKEQWDKDIDRLSGQKLNMFFKVVDSINKATSFLDTEKRQKIDEIFDKPTLNDFWELKQKRAEQKAQAEKEQQAKLEQERLERERQAQAERERQEQLEQKSIRMAHLAIEFYELKNEINTQEQIIIQTLDKPMANGKFNPLKMFDDEIAKGKTYARMEIIQPALLEKVERDLQNLNPDYLDYIQQSQSPLQYMTHQEKIKYALACNPDIDGVENYADNLAQRSNIVKEYKQLERDGIKPSQKIADDYNHKKQAERAEQERLERERQEQLEREQAEQERLERERAEQARQQPQNRPRFSP